MHGVLGWAYGGGCFLMSEVPLHRGNGAEEKAGNEAEEGRRGECVCL